jgi:hypothetical protein
VIDELDAVVWRGRTPSTALAHCVIGYAEIATRLAAVLANHFE